jgi:predicted aspartyl protease
MVYSALNPVLSPSCISRDCKYCFKVSAPARQVLEIPATVNGILVRALADTGSSITLISANFVAQQGLSKKPLPLPLRMHGVTGKISTLISHTQANLVAAGQLIGEVAFVI